VLSIWCCVTRMMCVKVEAGAPVHISVAARDRHGNLTPKLKAYQTFVVTADGASEEPVTFTADEKGLTFSAPLTVAGVYSVSVALQVQPLRSPSLSRPLRSLASLV
jgi:hypothetical protein